MYAPECRYHKKRLAMTNCASCGAPVCRDCAQPAPDGRLLCRECCVRQGLPQKRGGAINNLAIVSIIFATICALLLLLGLPGLKHLLSPINALTAYCLLLIVFNIFLIRRHKWAYWVCIAHAVLMLLLFAALIVLIVFAIVNIAGEDSAQSSYKILIVAIWLFAIFPLLSMLPFLLVPTMLVLPIMALCVLTRPAVRLEFGYLPKQKEVTV